MKKGIVSLFAMATVVTGSWAVSAETLEEALAAAYASNPQLMAQRASLRATDENVSQAKSGFLPSLTGTYSYDKTYADRTSGGVTVDADGDTERYGLTAQQNIFNGFSDRNSLRQAKSTVKAGRAQLQSVEQQILLEAVAAYMNVVRDEAVVELNKNNIVVLERQLQASNDRFRVGEVTRTDVAQSEARLENAKSTLLTAEATLASSRAQYRRVVGRTPAGLETPTSQPELPADLDKAIEIAMELSPGIQAARYNEEAARYSVNAVKGSLLPKVAATASYSKTDTSGLSTTTGLPNNSNYEAAEIGVNVTVPFFSGGTKYSQVRQAKQIRSQRMMEIYQAERVTQENVFVTWDQYRAAVGQITSTEASVRANEIALEGVKQEAYVGSRTTLDVLNAEQELLNSRVSNVRAQRDVYVAAYSLISSIGKLTARDLGLGIDLYDAEEYYDEVGSSKIIGFGTDVD
ncbi:TolC family outer membrane protein [Kordiimonas pumila]|uniref:TolC family outer membrane protein n=1 Tax=Kordiimonas pumila TaxID=2161677 RepID=A0ABV7D3D4_9PROT|nr:TolC family outer membrane protein [Kordiimonas pumila]